MISNSLFITVLLGNNKHMGVKRHSITSQLCVNPIGEKNEYCCKVLNSLTHLFPQLVVGVCSGERHGSQELHIDVTEIQLTWATAINGRS